jgi:hypothetical protein
MRGLFRVAFLSQRTYIDDILAQSLSVFSLEAAAVMCCTLNSSCQFPHTPSCHIHHHHLLSHTHTHTQADLEIAGAALAKTTADLTHALSSNKALLAWKVGAQPKMAALTTRLTKITRHREAWLEWVASRQRLLAHVSHALMSAHKAARQHQQLAATPADGREEMAEQLVGGWQAGRQAGGAREGWFTPVHGVWPARVMRAFTCTTMLPGTMHTPLCGAHCG